MPSDKLTRILKAKSPYSFDQISAMSDADGWSWVYANAAPRKDKRTQVCFTGFSSIEKEELANLAREHSLGVATTVTKDLAFLCTGVSAGPSKPTKIMLESGIKKNGIPKPNKNRPNMISPMVASGVSPLLYHAPNANNPKPVKINQRKSTRCMFMPITGEKNIANIATGEVANPECKAS